MDDSLAQTYKIAITSSPNASKLKSEQRAWLKTIRNKCTDTPCLTQAYTERIQELNVSSSKNDHATVNQDGSKLVTIRGILNVGTLDSGIEDENGNVATFLTDSKEGNKILDVCQSGDICEVTGNIIGEYSELVSVSHVKLIKSEQ